ncbi:FtsH protease activity modulator HflK [Facilibium subflavum]|uniref:FtsH protease activity modulator HflK n=1 Tax=Facilibium subflavum TaxID=2219058 RepID=UPI000E64F8C1|nr:FtsH protease activity modulator HflK [Facilibium subflavum]
MGFKFIAYNKGSDQGPPDLEEAIRRFFGKKKPSNNNGDQNNKSIYSRNAKSQEPLPIKKILLALVAAVVIIWALFGIYVIQPAQQAAILKFGKFSGIEGPGVHWYPPGFVQVIKKDVQVLNTISVDKLMLTSEENIVHVSFSVQYRIGDLEHYLFSTTSPELILRQALESAVRQVVGANKLEKILTVSRAQITLQVEQELKALLKKYQTGILVNEVIMQPAKAPDEVKSAFDDVIKAREDRERLQNEAYSYANKVMPVAKGKAQRILDEARAYSQKIVLEAEGDVASFNQLLPVYKQQPNIVENQLYYQTMASIFSNNKLYVIDGNGAKNLFYGEKSTPFAVSGQKENGGEQ